MSVTTVTTDADMKLARAQDHLNLAIKLISEVVGGNVLGLGIESYNNKYQEVLEEGLLELLRIRRKIGWNK